MAQSDRLYQEHLKRFLKANTIGEFMKLKYLATGIFAVLITVSCSPKKQDSEVKSLFNFKERHSLEDCIRDALLPNPDKPSEVVNGPVPNPDKPSEVVDGPVPNPDKPSELVEGQSTESSEDAQVVINPDKPSETEGTLPDLKNLQDKMVDNPGNVCDRTKPS